MATAKEKSTNIFGATLTRRDLVKAGGALFVGFGLVGDLTKSANAAISKNTLDATLPEFMDRDSS